MPNYDARMQEELERIILGTILVHPLLDAVQELKPVYFTDIRNQVICEIVLRLKEEGNLDFQATAQVLDQQRIDQGMPYLKKLKNYAVPEDLFPDLVTILKEEYLKHPRLFPS